MKLLTITLASYSIALSSLSFASMEDDPVLTKVNGRSGDA